MERKKKEERGGGVGPSIFEHCNRWKQYIPKIRVKKSWWTAEGKTLARRGKIARDPKIQMRRFRYANILQSNSKFRAFLSTASDACNEIDRICVEKIMVDGKGENTGAP